MEKSNDKIYNIYSEICIKTFLHKSILTETDMLSAMKVAKVMLEGYETLKNKKIEELTESINESHKGNIDKSYGLLKS